MRAKQDDERKRLLAARDSLRSAMGIGVLKLQGPTHLDPQACTGLTEKTGYLGKRPENALRITRRPWPKRFCTASMQGFTLAHSHVSQQPPSHTHTYCLVSFPNPTLWYTKSNTHTSHTTSTYLHTTPLNTHTTHLTDTCAAREGASNALSV